METFNEACHQGVIQRTARRLLEKEKEELCGGKVYVFDEKESGIKRWTDGRLWSPSRIIKDFLVYRELSTRDRNIKRHEPIDEVLQARIEAEGLKVHQCSKGTFILRNNGLLKKTISIKFNGSYQHMIIYEDNRGREESLLPPKAFEELRYIQPSEDIIKSEKMPKIIRNPARKKVISKKRQIALALVEGARKEPKHHRSVINADEFVQAGSVQDAITEGIILTS
nr:13668_t:CDS:2 [Entrophospora candida]CAG8514098.1 7150_t:CDS:2 [Entrophospora candida]